MSTPTNSAAWLDAASQPLRVGSAPLPTPGPSEIVIKNSAVAINPLDCHMQDHGVFVTQWPTIFGCDVAGTVHSMGSEVHDFKVGDRVIGCIVLPPSFSDMFD
jgi:NADPH:quinone reductase-like Zn-dependent oxidoreductase